mgnify:CR=1 FL=1
MEQSDMLTFMLPLLMVQITTRERDGSERSNSDSCRQNTHTNELCCRW